MQVQQHENILSQLENVRKDIQVDLKKLGADKGESKSCVGAGAVLSRVLSGQPSAGVGLDRRNHESLRQVVRF